MVMVKNLTKLSGNISAAATATTHHRRWQTLNLLWNSGQDFRWRNLYNHNRLQWRNNSLNFQFNKLTKFVHREEKSCACRIFITPAGTN
jgi:hypothetical protein